MKKEDYDIAVAYRTYPKVSRRPAIFPNDKYKLAKFCLQSFKESLGSLKVKIWALLDDCPPKYEELFREYFDDKDLEIIKLEGIGNYATFDLQMKILSDQNISDIIYFAEDDYFYFPNQFEKMVSLLTKNEDVDFVSPYDRLHDYDYDLQKPCRIKIYVDKHWRTAKMSYLTFLTTKKALEKTKHIFRSYAHNLFGLGHITDAVVWLCLTKHEIFNPFKITKSFFKNRQKFIFFYRAWRYGWKQILFGKSWKLWCPIPTIATHMQYNQLAPTIDWKNIFNKNKHNF